ncbi:MAG: PilN domain-containing protein [Candidatus Hydrothermarchaeales archaeon]
MDNISVEGKEIRLDGRASSFETVDRLEKKLTDTGFFKTIKLVGAKIDKKDKAVKFNFAIEKEK